MIKLINDDCLEAMKDISDNSIDLLFCDLPYGQTSCKWDKLIDLELFWKQVNRICKITTPMFFTCSTKFGVSLINSNPKNFRYDLIWVKSASCSFLNSKKMPMKKHEMIYVFYRKLPMYDLSSHKHKFIKERQSTYDPSLPNSVIRTDKGCKSMYGEETKKVFIYDENGKLRNTEPRYEPPLPNSVIKTELYSSENKEEPRELYRNEGGQYEPPLPNSILQEGQTEGDKGNEVYCKFKYYNNGVMGYEPPLPNSVIRNTSNYKNDSETYGNIPRPDFMRKNNESNYEPPLPNTLLEIKSEKGKHATQKPVELIKWCLKYYSKEGDTILDPTMGSGSTGVACNSMNRNFIGIEKNKEIFKTAEERLV